MPAGRGLYLAVETRCGRYGVRVVNVAEDPTALPASPLGYVQERFEAVKGRVARRTV